MSQISESEHVSHLTGLSATLPPESPTQWANNRFPVGPRGWKGGDQRSWGLLDAHSAATARRDDEHGIKGGGGCICDVCDSGFHIRAHGPEGKEG